MSKAKKRHLCKGGLCFHGAFSKKSDAKRKESEVPGAFIRSAWVGRGNQQYRYLVLTRNK